jgi:hypothetical protein
MAALHLCASAFTTSSSSRKQWSRNFKKKIFFPILFLYDRFFVFKFLYFYLFISIFILADLWPKVGLYYKMAFK